MGLIELKVPPDLDLTNSLLMNRPASGQYDLDITSPLCYTPRGCFHFVPFGAVSSAMRGSSDMAIGEVENLRCDIMCRKGLEPVDRRVVVGFRDRGLMADEGRMTALCSVRGRRRVRERTPMVNDDRRRTGMLPSVMCSRRPIWMLGGG